MKRRTLLPAFLLTLASILSAFFAAQAGAQTKFGIVGGSGSGGTGTVTSVAATVPAELSLTGSPITTTGTLAFSWANQLTSRIFAAPCGSTGTPTFRVLCAADIPTLDPTKITGTAVVDADARLTNARTPTAHATTHAAAGSDPITISGTQVSGNIAGNAGTASALATNPSDCSANQFANAIAANGNLTCAQPAASDVSGLAASATTDATNASNIASGTLNAARLPAFSGDVATSAGSAVTTIQANSVDLGVDTTGGYAASTTEGGPATTATALAANGTNCSAPNFARGVDASGNCEGAAIVASDLPNTAVTPGAYTSANITVDAQGRITSAANGSAATPGGSNTQVQFNDSSAFGGDSGLTYNKTTDVLTVAGGLTAPGSTAINSTGNVGVKTAATSDALTVLGSSYLNGQVNIQNNATSGILRVGGVRRNDVTTAGNTAGTETPLRSSAPDNVGTTGGNALLGDGNSVSYEFAGTIAGTLATDKRIRVRLGSTATSADTLLFDSGALAITSAGSWVLRGSIWRVGSSSQRSAWTLMTSDAAVPSKVAYIATSVSLSGNAFVTLTGEGTNANDVTLDVHRHEWKP